MSIRWNIKRDVNNWIHTKIEKRGKKWNHQEQTGRKLQIQVFYVDFLITWNAGIF